MSLVPCNHTSLLITLLLALTFFPLFFFSLSPVCFFLPKFFLHFSFLIYPLTGLVVVGACLAIMCVVTTYCFYFTLSSCLFFSFFSPSIFF
ncbi:hypothetical protein L873DRAFT_384940 [Choiromyces venosus 120613-1]|uniref:Uncharacterized protein n=1 Tax=Choiromyces venosus 120613-1 TaxID=1336337 RepID=A0A3N4IX05_9PEZI|nr:hypothetical protein L873DRAFT_384940 [Choiromyces venosus 120613-1]